MRLFTVALLISVYLPAGAQVKPVSKDTKMNSFISSLMQKMTVDEKIGQLNLLTGGEATTGSVVSSGVESKIKAGNVGGIFSMSTPARIRKAQEIAVTQTRMKIPIIFGMDVIHGYKTMFPIPLGLSCTWNMQLIERSAQIAASEASADGLNWTYSPMVDIARDPRWGRISEGSGEDPYLGSAIAKAMVKGYQQDDLSKNNTIMACVKHFALYGAAEGGRDYNTTDMSRVRMYNEYLPPYKAAVDAGVGSIMTSFNEIDGIPATANKWLFTDLLRRQWGFKGFVVTDYTAINEMIDHGMGDLQKVSELALKAGTDMDMVGEGFLTTLKKSLKEGKVTQQQIDDACRKVLEAKYKLGLFDDPYRYCSEERASKEIYTDANRKEARAISAESFVLLKNQGVLPIKKSGTIALIGPLADNRANMPGTWSVSADFTKPISVLEGLKQVAGNDAKIVYAKGSNLTEDSLLEQRATMFGKSLGRDTRSDETLLKEALDVATQSDVIVAALGEAAEMTGEAASRTDLGIPDVQKKLLEALLKTGKPVVLVLFAGRPMTLVWEQQHVPAILDVWFPGSEAGTAIADVLFGDVNPSGKLSTTFPQNVGQIPLYYNHKNTGRPLPDGQWFQKFRSNYLDVSNDPLYPFGFGLSYTTFTYGDIKLSSSSLKANQSIKASVTVTNSGSKDGKEVVQLYIRDMVGSITRPVKELKGFQKIELKAGESKTVSFTISVDDLKFYNNDLKFAAEPGDFKLFIGTNSRDVKETNFKLL
ncbi:MAG: beta-glucosidase BglX [Agriterribacter sp.]